jgi:hypothetical protein
MSTSELSFDAWKLHLKTDCERQDKLWAFSGLGEDCLKVLWELGTEPSVQGIIDGAEKAV